MTKVSLNDSAWNKIFSKHKIIERVNNDGHVHIHANDIRVFREPRLMTKFDHQEQLPKLFKENDLTILPTSRGGYVIGNFQTYHKFEQCNDSIIKIEPPTFLESLDFSSISSESFAVNCAFVSKILNLFTGEEELYPTVNGRMKSGNFHFNINRKSSPFQVDVKNSQVEIDGGFEGLGSLTLLEAKNYIADDFLVRQLFYPYKLWSSKIKKPVRPIFLSYTNGIFHLREYTFDDINNYNSIRLLSQSKYSIQHIVINFQTIQEILSKTKEIAEPEVPFPQADSFKRVINLGELLFENGAMVKEAITGNYMFDPRQTDYYFNALRYLGFAEKFRHNGQNFIQLSKEGRRIYSQNIDSRQLEFISAILSHAVFKKTLECYFNKGEMPTRSETVDIMSNSKLYNVGDKSTYERRSSTIRSWVDWIVSIMEE